jgi:hypothetical protein
MRLIDGILVALVMIVFLVAHAFGQESEPVVPISEKEEIEILAAQKESLQANQALQARQQQLPEFQRANAADAHLRELANKVYSSRKIDGSQYTLCDGPTLPECKDVLAGRIALRPVPKKKEEAKK